MYHETYHPVSDATLKYILDNKGWTKEDKEFISKEIQAANKEQKRRYRVTISEHKWIEINNGLLCNGSME